MASRSSGAAQCSLVLSSLIALPVAGLFLFLGVCLFVWFEVNPHADFPLKAGGAEPGLDSERVVAFFITTQIPSWLKGLLLTGVLAAAMSSLDSAMAAMSSSAVRDLLRPWLRSRTGERTWLWYGRACTLLFAALLLLTAWLLRDGGAFLWMAFKITSLTYGSLLGVFLLGRFSQRGSDTGNLLAMLAGTAASGSALWLIETDRLPVAWTWLLLLGTGVTFSLGVLFSRSHGRA